MFHQWEHDRFLAHVSPNNNAAQQGLHNVVGLLSSASEFDNSVPLSLEQGPWLAGGSLRSVVENSKRETDYDIFFREESQYEDLADWLAESERMGYRYSPNMRFEYRFTKTFEADHLTNYKLEVVPSTENAMFIDRTFSPTAIEYKVQLIHGGFFHNSAEALLASFDFTICQLATDGHTTLIGNSTLYDISQRKLVMSTVRYPVATLKRMMKYSRYGYNICNGEATKFLQGVVNAPDIVETRFKYVD